MQDCDGDRHPRDAGARLVDLVDFNTTSTCKVTGSPCE